MTEAIIRDKLVTTLKITSDQNVVINNLIPNRIASLILNGGASIAKDLTVAGSILIGNSQLQQNGTIRFTTQNGLEVFQNNMWLRVLTDNIIASDINTMIDTAVNANMNTLAVNNIINNDNSNSNSNIRDKSVGINNPSNNLSNNSPNNSSNQLLNQLYAFPEIGEPNDYAKKIGHIVIATGKYNNLNDKFKHRPTINDTIPQIQLSDINNDKRVLGVISRIDEKENRIIITKYGSGALWVSNYNNEIKNGDYITTSPIQGIGMRQSDDVKHSYTIAKATMDCTFDTESTDYLCTEVLFNKFTFKIALIGCTY
jgi:hypothetical protein